MHNEPILIVEDDPAAAQDLKSRLEILGYKVPASTTNGCEAISLTERLEPALVLMDILLSGPMDGIEAAEKIRARQVPVVYVTGFWEGAIFERAKLTEPLGYILKPYETRHLKTAIELGLHKHRVQRERIHQFEEMRDALGRAKSLTGRLSICAYCKKIKDEAGGWGQLEAYIMRHSSASFSHGLCPDCFEHARRRLEAVEQGDLPEGSLVLG
jgi:two-component system, response regulator PdtaR